MHQMDVKTTILNNDLEENVYMAQLKGFIIKAKRKHMMLFKEIHLWIKASFKIVLLEVWLTIKDLGF